VGFFSRRTVKGNARVATAIVTVPDQFSVQIASLGAMTNTFSPGAAGMHSPGASAKGWMGDRGYGVNRFAGELPYAIQNWAGGIQPIRDPVSKRLGAGAMPSGQPGLPSTGDVNSSGFNSLAAMSWGQLGRPGMGA
jgi:hypothetical protein